MAHGPETALAALRAKDDVTLPREYWTKADVYLRSSGEPLGPEQNLTTSVTGSDFLGRQDLDGRPGRQCFGIRDARPISANQKDLRPRRSLAHLENKPSRGALTQITGTVDDTQPTPMMWSALPRLTVAYIRLDAPGRIAGNC